MAPGKPAAPVKRTGPGRRMRIMEHAAKLFLGAMLGALVGLLLGSRVRSCSTEGCRTGGPVWYYIIAMAFCGAAVAHYATR